jgi:AcrR family transcriptional regulator
MSVAAHEDPRVARSRSCIIAAALEILESEGAAAVTVEGVAARAGVARTTVYRLWPGRGPLLVAAFEAVKIEHVVPVTDDLRADLIAHLEGLDAGLATHTWPHALPSLVEVAERDIEVAELARELSVRRRAPLVARLQRAVDAGELAADADLDAIVSQLAGPLFYRRFFTRQPPLPMPPGRLVDAVLSAWSPRNAS